MFKFELKLKTNKKSHRDEYDKFKTYVGKDLMVNRGVWDAETAGSTPVTRTSI